MPNAMRSIQAVLVAFTYECIKRPKFTDDTGLSEQRQMAWPKITGFIIVLVILKESKETNEYCHFMTTFHFNDVVWVCIIVM